MARFHQQFYVFDDVRPVPVVIRGYTEADFDELIAIQSETFPPPYPPEQWWNKEQLMQHVTLFPEGALCVEVDGMLAGSITSLIVEYDPMEPAHSWAEATDNGYIRTHQPDGNTLYIADICVRPRFRKLGLGKWLIQSLYHVTVERGLDRLLGGGRMPGYHRHAHEMSAVEYLDAVVRGDLKDPVITFLLRCGRTPVGVAAEYLEDEESCNYGVLMEWKNPFRG
ncbi:GNAT family N-acetyltransferase [Paenibacillus sp. FSL H8-0457]|uniref:GNAT family N-acetyltransferase n=1 Tax=unclassified Paenibacillus TaxID=185978 RepID=UPI000178A9C1|nr:MULTISPECIES: GNAT family N-acetyltransferase [unclassified Paenibacillus]ACX62426.1 GCN5-related N-acetyltransferase [Paenibacillus sp. Y412MC10]ETT62931.1 GCN5-like N-acetyltransferase [Paenibacillus sp. FSL H8-457]